MSEINRAGLTSGGFDSEEPQNTGVTDVSGVTGAHDNLPVVPPSSEVAAEASVGDARLTDVADDLTVPESPAALNPNWFRRHKTFLKISAAALAVVTAGTAYLTTRGGSKQENDSANVPKAPVATAPATPSASASAAPKPSFEFSSKAHNPVVGEIPYPKQGNINITRILSNDRVLDVPSPNGETYQIPKLRDPKLTSPDAFANSFLALFASYITVDKAANPDYHAAQNKLLASVLSGSEQGRANVKYIFEQNRQDTLKGAEGFVDKNKFVSVEFEDNASDPARFIETLDNEGNPAIALDPDGGQLRIRYWGETELSGNPLTRGQSNINDTIVKDMTISYTREPNGSIGLSNLNIHF